MRVAIVGTGPTGVYSFQHLTAGGPPLQITLYETGPRIGVGMPYGRDVNSPEMLANIASIELPPLGDTYLSWLQRQPEALLTDHGLDPQTLDERDFTPRVLIGDYFEAGLQDLVRKAQAQGHQVTLHPGCEVQDIRPLPEGLEIDASGQQRAVFDRVILATGHAFEPDEDLTDHYFPNPWSGLLRVRVPAVRVGIMGTSLSAIDAAMAVVTQHGRFIRRAGGLQYQLHRPEAASGLQITLMSWSGVLPEADFYCPLPYRALEVMTPGALARAMAGPAPFEAVYDLFRAQIRHSDPDWAGAAGLENLNPEAFETYWFAARENGDAFAHARANLAEVERNKAARHTMEWRYAVLRMHEAVETVVGDFNAADRKRFDATLKPVFVDCYAAVPEDSIRRLLALEAAGVLKLLPLGEDYTLEHLENHSHVVAKGKGYDFDIFIDARGQKPLKVKDIPFPTLAAALAGADCDLPEHDESFGLPGVPGYSGRLWLGALPWLMKTHPFIQGLTASAMLGETIARALKAPA